MYIQPPTPEFLAGKTPVKVVHTHFCLNLKHYLFSIIVYVSLSLIIVLQRGCFLY